MDMFSRNNKKERMMSAIKFLKSNRKIHRIFLDCSAFDVLAHANVKTMRNWYQVSGIEKTLAAQWGDNLQTIAICLHRLRKEKFTQAQHEAIKIPSDIVQKHVWKLLDTKSIHES